MYEATIQLPAAGSDKPAQWAIDEYALTVVHFQRTGARRLRAGWKTHLGAYLLLGPLDPDGEFDAYAGSAYAAGLGSRVPAQMGQRPWATHGFAVRRDTHRGFTSGQALFLEALLFDIGNATRPCRLANAARPAQFTVSPAERRWLRQCLDPVLAIIATHGYPLDASATTAQRAGACGIPELLIAGLVSPGETLYPRWKPDGVPQAVITRDGDITWQGRDFDGHKPSVPARLARGMRRTNGWDYWVVQRDGRRVPLEDLRQQYRDHQPAA